MKTYEIKVPSLGESTPEATVGEWHKGAGDAVQRDEILVELETDKVAVEVVSPADGVLKEIKAAAGELVSVDQLLATLEEAEAGAAAGDTSDASGAVEDAPQSASEPAATAMPAAARTAANNEVDLASVTGSGRDGRILKEDVVRASAGAASASAEKSQAAASGESTTKSSSAPQPVSASLGVENSRRVPMSPIRRTIARHLKAAQDTAAMLTTFNDVDMTAILAMRQQYREAFEQKHGVKLGFMGFFVKAAVAALRGIPELNSQVDGDDIIYHDHVHVGVAVGTPRGLVVPVVRHADTLSLAQIEMVIAEYGRKAREGKLSVDDMRGGTFTISNGGIFGSLLSTPILNAPQAGIVGMHRTEKRAMVDASGNIVARDMMYLALSYDHRIVDGREAVTFLVTMKNALEDPSRLLLDV